MKDPLGSDPLGIEPTAIVHKVSIVQMQKERALSAYRNNIAMPDVHIARMGDFSPVDAVGEDGEAMTFERRQQLMEGKKPWIEDPEADRRELVSEEELPTEAYGDADIARRQGIRRVKPEEMTEELMAQRSPTTCVWSSGSDAVTNYDELTKYVGEAIDKLVGTHGRLLDCFVMSKEGASAIDYLTKSTGLLDEPSVLKNKVYLHHEVRFDDTQFHHIQLWAAGFPRLFASVFIHRELLRKLREGETTTYIKLDE
jgi:hypothetical protein